MGKGNRGMNYKKELRRYQPYLDYIKEYSCSLNAASGSKVDANANVENKNVTTLTGELYKKDGIGINRLRMYQKLAEMFGEEYAERYIDQLENHEIYKHDETNPLLPYCVSITMYPFLFDGLRNLEAEVARRTILIHLLDHSSICVLRLRRNLQVRFLRQSSCPIWIILCAKNMATIIICTQTR